MKTALLQVNSTIGDFARNTARLLDYYQRACAAGAEFVIAPELVLCGYPPRDLLLRSDFVDRNLTAIEEIARAVHDIPLCLGYVDWNTERPGKPLRNAAVTLHHGKAIHRVHKSLLPTYDVFDEDRYFEPGATTEPLHFNGRRLGITICEDIWNDQDFWPERLYRRDPIKELIAKGAEIILNVSASPWHQGKERGRAAMLSRIAADEKVPLAQVNLVGANDELIFDGHSLALDRAGRELARGPGFAEAMLMVDLAATGGHVAAGWGDRHEALFKGLSLGIGDYVRKCGFKSVVLGLSGGIDSAVTAVLAVDALGAANVMGIAMPSRFSSEGSQSDAAQLARALGIRYETLPIEEPFTAMERHLEPLFAGSKPNEAEENIQSRLRGVTLMALSNKFGPLVLTTGNKSEISVGYCTLYGDMCGALAPIGDVFKTDVFSLARWINREHELIPWATITKPPSAELRPNQTDQDSLPPYETLDAILDAYVVRNLTAAEIVALGHDGKLVADIINKVTFSEYKRRQAAPVLKVSTRAFGTGRRIPVAQRFRTG